MSQDLVCDTVRDIKLLTNLEEPESSSKTEWSVVKNELRNNCFKAKHDLISLW